MLRVSQPDLPRPFKMWGYPWTTLTICLGTGAFLVASIIADLKHTLFTVAVIAFTYPLYLFVTRFRRTREASGASIQLAPDIQD
jgi:APA family basic amino acid/polyamine antiporter